MKRFDENPILTPADVQPTRDDLEVMCTLNPAAVKVDGETLLLVRVAEKARREKGQVAAVIHDAEAGETRIVDIGDEDPLLDTSDPRKYFYRGRMLLTSLSHLRIARSRDGRNFTFDPAPALTPANEYEAFGVEDARITFIDRRYYITYTAVSEYGVCVGLASTTDFVTFERHGLIFPPYQKDVVIFPEKNQDGLYVCRHRPYMNEFNDACIWTAYSPDLLSWGRHKMTLAPTAGTWESERVGCGGAPIKTGEGWLEIYHACGPDGYALGAMLSDLEAPEKLLCRSPRPVLLPETDYEKIGVFNNTVFSNGLVAEADGTLTLYYGAADRICAGAVTTVDEMVAAAKGKSN